MTLTEEQVLVQKAQEGDGAALGLLWDEFSPKLFGYLVNVLRDKPLAEDVFQTTWLKATEKLSSFHMQGISLSAWLFAIAKNECRQHWRKAQRPEVAVSDGEPVTDTRGELYAKLLAEQILEKLSEDDRELLRLRYIADLSTKEIARVLNINSIAVRVRVSRAVSRARQLATGKIL